MRITIIVFLFLFITLMIVELSETARGRGGSNSRGSTGGSTGGSRRPASSRGGSSKSRRSTSGSSSKPKITNDTPIKPTSVRSPVIVKQTKPGLRLNTFTKVVVAYLELLYFLLSDAPVFREGYPLYRSYVSIPDNRAVRLSYEGEKLLGTDGNLCIGKSTQSRTLRDGIDGNLVELSTTVKYNNRTLKIMHGIDHAVSLEDIKDQRFEVTSHARYNQTSIVAGTNCTQVEKTIKGTMIKMYQANPNATSRGSSLPNIMNNKLLSAVIALFAFIKFSVFLY